MSLAPFVCRERDGIALCGTERGERGMEGGGKVGKAGEEQIWRMYGVRRKREGTEGRKEEDKGAGKPSGRRHVSDRQTNVTWNNSEIIYKKKNYAEKKKNNTNDKWNLIIVEN